MTYNATGTHGDLLNAKFGGHSTPLEVTTAGNYSCCIGIGDTGDIARSEWDVTVNHYDGMEQT